MKLTFVMGMVLCDLFCSRMLNKLQSPSAKGSGAPLLHGMSGLLLIGIALSLYVVR